MYIIVVDVCSISNGQTPLKIKKIEKKKSYQREN